MNTSSSRVDDTFFEDVIDTVTEGVVSFEADGTIVFANRAARELLGYAPGELLERSVGELLPDDKRSVFDRLQRRTTGTKEAPVPFAFLDHRGREVPVTFALHRTTRDEDPLYIANFHELAGGDDSPVVRAPESAFDPVFEHPSIGIAAFDPESWTITDCNDRFRDLLDRSSDDVRSLDLAALAPRDEESLRTLLSATIDEGWGWSNDIRLRNGGGEDVRVVISTSTIEHSDRLRVLASVHAYVQRTEYERRLKALNEAARELMVAETPEQIGQITVDVVETVLQRTLTAVWCTTDDEGVLRATAASQEATSVSGGSSAEPIAPIIAETAEMTVFENGEPVVLDAYETVTNPAHPEMGLDERLVVPLGTHGLLAVSSTGDEGIDAPLQELIEILGKHTRTAFDRLEREQLLRQRSAVIDAAIDGMAIANEDGVFTYVNDVYANLFGFVDSSELVGTSWRDLFGSSELARYESEVLPVVSQRGSWRGEAIGRSRRGDDIPLEISLSVLADGSSVCIARDITERKAQERQLEALTDGLRSLMTAGDSEAVCQTSIDAVEDVLGFERSCIRLFDPDTNRLDCVALSNAAEALLKTQRAYDLEATLAGHAFREGQAVIDHRAPERREDDHSSLHVPVGEYGVLTIVSGGEEDLDERNVQLVEMLAVNARTAIDRAERVQQLRTHEREMRQQRDQLETHNQINNLVQEIGRRLLEATTREELERTICERLVDTDLYQSAWIGDIEANTDRITTRVGFGITDDDLEAINGMSISSVGRGTVERMLETGSLEVVRSYQFAGEYPNGEESSPDVLSTAAIPLTYGDQLLGVLVVNGTGGSLFSEETISGFESLGKVTGFAINATRNRRLLLTDSVIELVLLVEDSQRFYLAVSSELDCECRFERSVPIEAGKILNYHTITGSDPTSVLEVAGNFAQIENARVISEGEDSLLLQTLTSESTAHVALQAGATLQSAVAIDGEARIVLETPQTADVRKIVSLFDEQFSSVELAAKRERDRSIETATEFRRAVDDGLTEKQRSALESAYASGYYDWPRAITAEELAASMEISSSTLHQHLRKGIWSLLRAFLDDQSE